MLMMDLEGLARELALRFSSAGWTVFIQSPTQVEVPRILYRWQGLKKRIHGRAAALAVSSSSSSSTTGTGTGTGTGTNISASTRGKLIPLIFNSRGPSSRTAALNTIEAYCRDNGLVLGALINCVDVVGTPRQSRPPPPSPSTTTTTNSAPTHPYPPPPLSAIRQTTTGLESAATTASGQVPLVMSSNDKPARESGYGEVSPRVASPQHEKK
jgi:hypothetical protein